MHFFYSTKGVLENDCGWEEMQTMYIEVEASKAGGAIDQISQLKWAKS